MLWKSIKIWGCYGSFLVLDYKIFSWTIRILLQILIILLRSNFCPTILYTLSLPHSNASLCSQRSFQEDPFISPLAALPHPIPPCTQSKYPPSTHILDKVFQQGHLIHYIMRYFSHHLESSFSSALLKYWVPAGRKGTVQKGCQLPTYTPFLALSNQASCGCVTFKDTLYPGSSRKNSFNCLELSYWDFSIWRKITCVAVELLHAFISSFSSMHELIPNGFVLLNFKV